MALDQAANFVVDELQSSVTDTATTFSVANASQFPGPANGEYNLVVFDASRPSKDPDVEVVRVTGRDTTNNDLTVSRGQETTTAVSHASGTAVELSYTAKFRDDIQTEIDNAGGTTVTSIAPTEAVDSEEPTASGTKAIAVGPSYTTAGGTESSAIGTGAGASGDYSTALGPTANAFGNSSIGIGYFADAQSDNDIAIGREAETNNTFAGNQIVIGREAVADAEYGIALGYQTTVNTSNTARIGTKQTVIGAIDGGQIADTDLNNSELAFELDEANSNIVFRVKNSNGTVKTGTVSLS